MAKSSSVESGPRTWRPSRLRQLFIETQNRSMHWLFQKFWKFSFEKESDSTKKRIQGKSCNSNETDGGKKPFRVVWWRSERGNLTLGDGTREKSCGPALPIEMQMRCVAWTQPVLKFQMLSQSYPSTHFLPYPGSRDFSKSSNLKQVTSSISLECAESNESNNANSFA